MAILEQGQTDYENNVVSDIAKASFKQGYDDKPAVRTCIQPDPGADPIPVTFEAGITNNIFGSVSSVASSTQTTVLSYMVPASKSLYIKTIEVGGTNIATYEVEIDSTLEARKRTAHGGGLSAEFDFNGNSSVGVCVGTGLVVSIKVEHARPLPGDFEARIIGTLK